MDKILYECVHCKARMSAKNRPGSTQFMSMELQGLQSFTCASIEDDPGRPIFSEVYKESPFPRSFRVNKEEEANFYLTHDYQYGDKETNRRKVPEAAYASIDPAKDLVIKISIWEKTKLSDEEDTPRKAIERFFKYMAYLKEEGKEEQGYCYLSGGHDWQSIGVIPNG